MVIEIYRVHDNATYYKDPLPYWASAVSPPPKNATNVEECGCYIVKKDERWGRYCVYHHLCENHMIEHNLSAKQFIKEQH